jgi:2'-5' RNA ligase
VRLFLALDLPQSARTEVVRWRDAMTGGRDDLRPIPAASLHVTLVFLGSKPADAAGTLWEVAAAAAGACRAPGLTPLGVSAVPRRRVRLFALDLADDGGRAAGLHRAVAEALAEADLHRAVAGALAEADLHETEDRPFWPHVTLARVRRGVRPEPWSGRQPLPAPFTSSSLTLYESQLSPAGARYRVLERLELRL